MTRNQLEHVLRAAAGTANVRDIVVIGSQSILGAHPDAPPELTESLEADVFPKQFPELCIVIDGAIGEMSLFHQTFGYYAHGVDETTAVLPLGWRDRLIRVENPNTMGAVGWCLEPGDLAISKLAASREKDIAFVEAMIRRQMVSPELLRDRALAMPQLSEGHLQSILARIERWTDA